MASEAPKARRLVLHIPARRRMKSADFLLFADKMRELEADPGAEIEVQITEDGNLKFYVPVAPLVPPKKTRQRRAVEKQIEEHQERVKAGEEVPGHIPPVKPRRIIRKKKR